ncbi:tetrahydrofolate dehydrogenase/cyclohydrolase [Phakopsora pachyrhizi]|uniref:Tetrahydrofolate dehydrogenase/cyclohydrolase n=1 Tax=Phakopsora pachyrhizi TaxID=170000 RepID=A0AAV0B4B4_PHAPC|nr:tetrahydrofolate dehydrogenase/cyclohydrolase [Phakopsora pachyrhizi]
MSSSSSKLIDGTATAARIRSDVANRIKQLQSKKPSFKPSLAIIQQGDRPDSTTYVNMKRKAAEECGISFVHLILPDSATEEELSLQISRLNSDPSIYSSNYPSTGPLAMMVRGG